MSAPRDAPARDVDARARGTDERERGSSASRGTTTDENAAPERDGAATSGRDAVKDVEDGFTRFNLGAGDAGRARVERGRSFRARANGAARTPRASAARSERGGGDERATWGAFAEKLEREATSSGRESPVKTFELRAMPEKSPGRARSASQQNLTREDSGAPRAARSLDAEFEKDTASEPARSPDPMTSPEPMVVDSPNDSEASEGARFTPPRTFTMGAASTSGTKKSASFRSRASALRVEAAVERVETPASTKSEASVFGTSPQSPIFEAPTPRQFTFTAPPPTKTTPTVRATRSAEKSSGDFKMGADDSPALAKHSRSFKYAQRAGRDRRPPIAAATESPSVSVGDIEQAASQMSLHSRDSEETERLRQLGNALYREEKYVEADEMYSRAIMVFASAPRTNAGKGDESPLGVQIDTFVGRDAAVLLTNRAAARMMIPNESTPYDEYRVLILKALTDCERAVRADASYTRAQLRVAACHMKLGSFGTAMDFLEVLSASEDADVENAKIEAKAASEHLSKVLGASLKLRACVPGLPRLYSDSRARKLDETYESVVKSVAALSSYPLLSSSEFGKPFVEAKAALLIACGAYQEASAFISEIETLGLSKEGWVPEFTFSALLGKGDPHAACEYVTSVSECDVDEEAIEMARTMLKGKEDGNKMFNAEKYAEAVASYTLAFDAGKVPVAAAYCSIVLGNRAAAYQGLNEFLNALADCGRALAFNPWNIKALSRRATLHESIRCWDDAIRDLRSYVEIAGNAQYDLFATAQERKNALAMATDRLRRLETTKTTQANSQVDMYRILGLDELKDKATQTDIKKAYRALALKYHPDKANRNMPSWAPASELHDDADRLFKLIGETNAQLSDQALRRVYDETERIRAQRERHASYERSFTRSNTWSAPTPNDFQFGQDAPWMSPNSRRSKPRVNRQSSGKNYYWNF